MEGSKKFRSFQVRLPLTTFTLCMAQKHGTGTHRPTGERDPQDTGTHRTQAPTDPQDRGTHRDPQHTGTGTHRTQGLTPHRDSQHTETHSTQGLTAHRDRDPQHTGTGTHSTHTGTLLTTAPNYQSRVKPLAFYLCIETWYKFFTD